MALLWGNRFSEDSDLYGSIEESLLRERLEERGLLLRKLKHTGQVLFAKISNGRVEVRLEVNGVAEKEGVVRAYERMDGSFLDIYTLPVEELIREKMAAYQGRRFIRDLYDIYHLVRSYDVDAATREAVRRFAENLQPPVDESILKSLVYSGVAPTFKAMVTYLRSV